MSLRAPDPKSAKSSIEARRNALDAAILKHLRSHGCAMQSKALAAAIGASWSAVVGRLHALVRIQAVRRRETGQDRAGQKIITFQAVNPESVAESRGCRAAEPFRPLQAVRATIIPVRSQGRIAIASLNEAPVSLGRAEFREIA